MSRIPLAPDLSRNTPGQPMGSPTQFSDSNTAFNSPNSTVGPASPGSNGNKRKFNAEQQDRSEADSFAEANHDERYQRTTKRACNECRQQKLKCDVVPEPFKRCSRCNKLKLECRIDANFKRVGKRSKNAEMEKELIELRRQLVERDSSGATGSSPATIITTASTQRNSDQAVYSQMNSHVDQASALHRGVAGSLLELSRGADTPRPTRVPTLPTTERTLQDTNLKPDRIDELFRQYLICYHPFLPVLDPHKTPDQIYDLSPLLFWVIISVAARRFEDDPTLLTGIVRPLQELIWSTIAAVPQNYHVVKALAIVCTWPLPKRSTSQDQTFILSGVMLQVALQTGLHRPSHVQDFYTRQKIELREEDIQDRLKTWAVCNIVTQSISTALGQPPKTVYDYTLTSISEPVGDVKYSINIELYWRLQIERFVNKVSQKCYNNRTDPIGITGEEERAAWMSLLLEDYRILENEVVKRGSSVNKLYIQAAGLHLHLSAFFDTPAAKNYMDDLMRLYFAATTFLRTALELQINNGPALRYATGHLMMIVLGAGTALMKLLNSFFNQHIEVDSARKLFSSTVWGVRAMSVWNNDLPARLAEVLAQLWRSSGAGVRKTDNTVDDSLKLKIQCRMSMSLVFDSVWRWREQFQFNTADGTTANLDAAVVHNPTNPDLNDNPATNSVVDPNLSEINASNLAMNPVFGNDYNYEMFDPLTWMLDAPSDLSYVPDSTLQFGGQEIYS